MSSCTNPILAARLYKPLIGKSVIKIIPRRYGTLEELYGRYGKDNLLLLPCGHCQSCLSNRKKEWAVRCCLEALDHQDNCFVTLTYDPEHYDDKYHKEHLQDFIKSLRNDGIKLRYFGASERGDELGRCHYHMILFGFFPQDAKPWAKSLSGFMQYTSEILTKAWKRGFVTVAEFHPAQASYVAGYVVKKFEKLDPDSFHIQSTRPGIGQAYVLRNAEKIYDTDNLVVSFGSHKFAIPRYFDKVVQEYYSLDLDDVKAKRLRLAQIQMQKKMQDLGLDNEFKVLVHEEEVNKSKFHYKKRRF